VGRGCSRRCELISYCPLPSGRDAAELESGRVNANEDQGKERADHKQQIFHRPFKILAIG
jgi:hypothetical protein